MDVKFVYLVRYLFPHTSDKVSGATEAISHRRLALHHSQSAAFPRLQRLYKFLLHVLSSVSVSSNFGQPVLLKLHKLALLFRHVLFQEILYKIAF